MSVILYKAPRTPGAPIISLAVSTEHVDQHRETFAAVLRDLDEFATRSWGGPVGLELIECRINRSGIYDLYFEVTP